MTGREWAYMTPLVLLSLWIGVYPKTFVDYIQKPVAAVVRQVRPDYPFPGGRPDVAPAAPERAATQTGGAGDVIRNPE